VAQAELQVAGVETGWLAGAGGGGFPGDRWLVAFQLTLSIAQAGTEAPVVETGIAAVAGNAAAEAGIAAAAGIAAETGIAGDPGIAAAGVGKLLEAGSAETGTAETGTAEAGSAGAEVDAGILAECSAVAVKLVSGQTAQTGQTRQSPECFQTVVQLAVEPSGSQRIQRPGAATAQFVQLVQQQTGCRRLRLKTGSKLFLSSAAGQRQ